MSHVVALVAGFGLIYKKPETFLGKSMNTPKVSAENIIRLVIMLLLIVLVHTIHTFPCHININQVKPS
jgi:hypothetical protein